MKLSVKLTIGLLGSLTGVVAAVAATPIDPSSLECPHEFSKFKNSVSWYQGQNRVTITADSACGSKLGDPYELKHVVLKVQSGSQVLSELYAETGTYSAGQNKLVLGKSISLNAHATWFQGSEVLMIDLKTGEFRAPGRRVFLNSSELIANPQHAGRKPSSVYVQSAYKNSSGEFLVEIDGSTPEERAQLFPAGNRLYFGSHGNLQQLELTLDETSAGQRQIQFYDLKFGKGNSGIQFNATGARVSCEEAETPYEKVSAAELQSLQQNLKNGRLHLTALPHILDPLYFFQIHAKQEFVYVREPRFNFHGNFEVLVGSPGKMKRMELVQAENGVFQFRSGGGMVVPGPFELFPAANAQRGTPTLIRNSTAEIEKLERPSLDRRGFEKLARQIGIRKIPSTDLQTPCHGSLTASN